jgi:hypothetical protein
MVVGAATASERLCVMPAKIPFIPKSVLKMRFGDYWPVRRQDGDYGFFVFLGRWGESRVAFTAGLVDHVSVDPQLSPTGAALSVIEAGHLHVKSLSAASTPIVGNIADRLAEDDVRAWLHRLEEKSIGWGYGAPAIRVNRATARQSA